MTAIHPSFFMKKEGGALLETLATAEVLKKVAAMGEGRAEIDTSAPFESVKEAVDRFGGSAVWKSQLKPLFDTEKLHSAEELKLMSIQEQSAQLGKELDAKKQETLELLTELETTKRIINCLQSQLYEESSEENDFPKKLSENSKQSPGSIFSELKQAKRNLFRTRSYFAGIRATIESFNIKVEEEKSLLQKNHEKLSLKQSEVSSLEENLEQLTLKLEFCKNTKAAKSEVLKLTSEIDQMNATIKAAELVKSKAQASFVVLSVEEYAAMTRKVLQADEFSREKIEAAMIEKARANRSKLELLLKIEEASEDLKASRKVLEESVSLAEAANRRKCAIEEALRRSKSEQRLNLPSSSSRKVMKQALSIGEILCRKLMEDEDFEYDVGISDGGERGKDGASLGQIMSRRNGFFYPRNGGGSMKEKAKDMVREKDLCSVVISD